jgi:RimJ/RimL family protein N-acetyltransferase
MLIAAAICPAAPLLARELTGTDAVIPDLRRACRDAVAGLVASAPDLIAVVGVAAEGGRWDEAGRLDLSVFAPALRGVTEGRPPGQRGATGGRPPGQVTLRGATGGRPPGQVAVPPSLGLGGMLLDQADYDGPRELWSVTEDETAAGCAALGARLAGLRDRVALLVMADGSACRTLKAPGYLDARSEPFDAEVGRAIRDRDAAALLALDADLAHELMATGRPGWQALAGAARECWASTQVRYCDDPFGVLYTVASVTCDSQPLVALRHVADGDLDAIFDQMRDPEGVWMAAFTADDPSDRAAFDAHMAMIRSSPNIWLRAVTSDGQLVGTIAAFPAEGATEVTYWVDRACWGRGIASRALALLLDQVTTRPLRARAASDNAASLRVLRKSGFEAIGTEVSFAPARGGQIEETILRKG